MDFGVGSQIPQSEVQVKGEGAIGVVKTEDYFKDSKVVMIAIPGAFTPTCSREHLPGFMEHYDDFKAKGVDKIVCMAVNDAHVMKAWGDANNVGDKIDMLADPHFALTKALGLDRDMGAILGVRAARCAVIIDDGVVTKMLMEDVGAFEVSSASHVLGEL